MNPEIILRDSLGVEMGRGKRVGWVMWRFYRLIFQSKDNEGGKIEHVYYNV